MPRKVYVILLLALFVNVMTLLYCGCLFDNKDEKQIPYAEDPSLEDLIITGHVSGWANQGYTIFEGGD